MGAEQYPPVVLDPLPSLPEHHRGDRAREVVVADVFGRNAAQSSERVDVSLEECFLRLRRIDAVDGLPGVGEPVDEHVALRLHLIQDDPDLTEIHFSLRAGRVLLRRTEVPPKAWRHQL